MHEPIGHKEFKCENCDIEGCFTCEKIDIFKKFVHSKLCLSCSKEVYTRWVIRVLRACEHPFKHGMRSKQNVLYSKFIHSPGDITHKELVWILEHRLLEISDFIEDLVNG